MKKVFITGGTGFLGKHLVEKLKLNDALEVCAPSSQECNLLEKRSLSCYTDQRFDTIIHLAAWTQAGDFCLNYPGEQWLKNQQINTNLLDWWANEQNSAKLVFMGTSCSYPENAEHIEDNYLKGDPTPSLFTYAMTKRMLLIGAKAMGAQYDLEYCSFIPSTLYGSGYHTDGRQMHFIFDLVRKIYDAAEGGPIPTLWGDGSQIRELVHVDDFINIMLALIPRVSNDIVNVGGFCQGSIRDYAETVARACGYDPTLIRYDTSRYVGAKKKVLINTRLQELLPKIEIRTLESGIDELVSWYKVNKRYF